MALRCLTAAPADDMIVVSEIGEQWSPQTPRSHAGGYEHNHLIRSIRSYYQCYGDDIPNVPHDVPDAKT